MGNLYTFGNITTYYSSYLHKESNGKIVTDDLYFYVPTLVFIEYIAILPSGYLEKLIGARMTTLLGLIFTIIHYIILYYTKNYWIGLLAMGIFGFGIGIGYFPLVNIAWKYFPEKKGFLSGIILCSFGMGSFFWIFIAEKIINPENEQVQLDGPEKDYYSSNSPTSSNIIKFWYYMIFIVIIFTIIITLLSFDYYEDEETDKIKESLIEQTPNKENEKEEEESKIDTKLILKIFFSWDYSKLILLQLTSSIFLYLVSVTMRPFGETTKHLEIKYLKTLSLINSLLNGTLRIFWGFIIDCIGWKLSLYIDRIILIFASGGYYFFGSNIVLYYIINIIAAIGNSGISVLSPIVNKEVGGEYFLILMGYAGLYYGASSMIGPFFVKVLDIKKRGEIVYMITYLISCGFSILSFILIFFIGDTIDYNKFKTIGDNIELIKEKKDNNDEEKK